MSTPRQRQPTSLAGRLALTVFFLIFAGFGTLFIGFMLREFLHKNSTRSWTPTPCRILSNTVLNDRNLDDLPYTLHIRYRFQWDASSIVSTQLNLSGGRFKDLARADRLGKLLPVGSESTCYVNPKDPTQSVLRHESSQILWFLPLPALFLLIGLGGILSAWRNPASTGTSPASNPTEPLSSKAYAKSGQRFASFIVLIFILFGSIFLYIFTLKPLYLILTSQSWIETPCTIESSEIRHSRGNKGTTYSVDIAYHYTFRDSDYRGNRYDFIGASTSGYESKQRVIAQYPPGHRTVCYVNPSDPSEAVLHRGITPVFWVGLIPLAFVLVGIAAWVHLRKQSRITHSVTTSSASLTTPSTRTSHSNPPASNTGPSTLKPRTPRIASALGLLLFGLIWNGIISVFIYQIVRSFKRGDPEWFLTLFMIPFVLVGLGVLVAFIHQTMALFNPVTHLTLDPGSLVPGQKARLRWSLQGRTHRLQQLQIALEGQESATYRRGTDTATAQSLFHQTVLVNLTHSGEMQSGEAIIEIPPHAPPTCHLQHNKIEWSLRIVGKIARWPDIHDTYSCTVEPAPTPTPDLNPDPSPSNTPTQPAEQVSSDSTLKVGLKDGQRVFRAGETLHGATGWSRPTPPTHAEVRLFYFTQGRGTSDVVVVESIELQHLKAQDAHPFTFQLPHSPPTIEGTLVSILWAIEVVLQPGHVHARYPFTLSQLPNGSPHQLTPVTDTLQTTARKGFHVPFRST